MKFAKISLATLFFTSSFLMAQIGINTSSPQATLQIEKNTENNIADGIIVPRLTIDELEQKINNYNEDQNSTLIFITSKLPGNLPSTIDVNEPGYYYFTKTNLIPEGIWKPLGGYAGNDPVAVWVRDETNDVIKLAVNSDNLLRAAGTYINVTDAGNLSLGINKADDNAIFEAFSYSKGILTPRLTKQQRNEIKAPIQNGLLIFNIDENCFNYYDNNWRSLCGTYQPAKIDVIDCSQPNQLTLTQGEPLTSNNSYLVKIIVSEPGTYEITARTTNGYSFVKTGIFNETGTYNLYLDGQGIPNNGQVNDTVKILLNGVDITPQQACSTIRVNNSVTTYTLDCNSISKYGTYTKGINVNSSNYITMKIQVTTPGILSLETETINGIVIFPLLGTLKSRVFI